MEMETASPQKSYFGKMQGGGPLPARTPVRNVALAWCGGFLAIAAVALMARSTHASLILGSFGATCVLVFGFPESPFSQPRNVIGGHFLASLIGLLFFHLVGPAWWSMSLAVGTAIALMQLTRTVHPPAGSNPVIVFLLGAPWKFLLTPTLIGAVILVIVAVFYNNLASERQYPQYWI
jgi:CBS-domain-containing membrane protein